MDVTLQIRSVIGREKSMIQHVYEYMYTVQKIMIIMEYFASELIKLSRIFKK